MKYDLQNKIVGLKLSLKRHNSFRLSTMRSMRACKRSLPSGLSLILGFGMRSKRACKSAGAAFDGASVDLLGLPELGRGTGALLGAGVDIPLTLAGGIGGGPIIAHNGGA